MSCGVSLIDNSLMQVYGALQAGRLLAWVYCSFDQCLTNHFFFFTHVLDLKSNQIMEVGRGNALWNLASMQFSPTIVSELNSQLCATLLLVPPHLQITATLSFLSSLYLNSGKEPELGTYKDNFMKFCGRTSGQNGFWTVGCYCSSNLRKMLLLFSCLVLLSHP